MRIPLPVRPAAENVIVPAQRFSVEGSACVRGARPDALRMWRRMATLLLVAVASLAATRPAFGQIIVPGELQQVAGKLVGTGATGPANQGAALALSADGYTAIVGAPSDNVSAGAAWIFTRSNGTWSQQGNKLFGSDIAGAAHLGNAVAISSDGNTVAIGGFEDNSGAGAVWVFTRSNGVWSQQGAKLIGAGASGSARQGFSVALSDDGNTLAEGGNADNDDDGAVWIFTRSAGVWTSQGSKLVGAGASTPAQQGYGVQLSSDGNTLLETGPNDASVVGAAWFFTRSGSSWSPQGDKVVPSSVNSAMGSYFGRGLSLTGDGNTAVISAPSDNSGQGGFWIFTRSGGVWTQQGDKFFGTGDNSAYQGYGLSISRDGSTILVPGPYDNNGGAWIFNKVTGIWKQQGGEIVLTGNAGVPVEGLAAAISGNGRTALLGGPQDNSGAGATWTLDAGTNFWSSPVGTPITQTVSIAFPYQGIFTGATLSTQGGANVDFLLAATQPQSGACTPSTLYNEGESCSLTLQFTPSAPGVRTGAVQFHVFAGGPPGIQLFVHGMGLAPQTGFVSGVITTVAGTGTSGYSGDGGAAIAAQLKDPKGVAVDGLGNVYIADCSASVVRRVDVVTGLISTYVGNGTNGYSGDFAPATSAELGCPVGLAVDGGGDLLIADYDNNVVRVVVPVTGNIYPLAGVYGASDYAGDGGTATSAHIGVPTGLAVDPAGNVYISDLQNSYVREVDAVTGIISTVAGTGSPGYSGDGGPAINAELQNPLGLAIDGAGHLYIADYHNNRIRAVSFTTGLISTVAGNGSSGYSGDGGAATGAELQGPEGVAVDAAGNVYITDSGNNTVRKVDVGSGIIRRVGGDGTGTAGGSRDGGAATSALLSRPDWPAVDGRGNLYFTDESNLVIREITGAAALTFGSVATGANSDEQDLTISNNGTVPLSLSSLAVSSNFTMSGTDTTCSRSALLTAGTSCVVGVVFAPTSGGPLAGTLTLAPSIVSLSGTGLALQTSTALSISPIPANAGQSITFTATILPVPAGAPYGTVSFYSDCDLLGSATVNASGVATFSTSSLAATTYNVYAVYSGNPSSVGSVSSSVNEVVNASFAVDAPQTPFTTSAGGSINVTVTVPPLGGAFNNLVSMSAAGLPAGAVATFTPISVTPGSAGTSTVMIIQLANPAAGGTRAPREPIPYLHLGVALTAFLLFLVCKRSRALQVSCAVLTLASISMLFAGCGGGTARSSTFLITVTGTSGAQHAAATITMVVHE
jgi:sugar lactone lactonase YvrE